MASQHILSLITHHLSPHIAHLVVFSSFHFSQDFVHPDTMRSSSFLFVVSSDACVGIDSGSDSKDCPVFVETSLFANDEAYRADTVSVM